MCIQIWSWRNWGQLENGPRKPLRITRNNGVWENPNLVKAREEEKQRRRGRQREKICWPIEAFAEWMDFTPFGFAMAMSRESERQHLSSIFVWKTFDLVLFWCEFWRYNSDDDDDEEGAAKRRIHIDLLTACQTLISVKVQSERRKEFEESSSGRAEST